MGGALIKAKTASVHYGPKAFSFFSILDIFDTATKRFGVSFLSFPWNFVFIYYY